MNKASHSSGISLTFTADPFILWFKRLGLSYLRGIKQGREYDPFTHTHTHTHTHPCVYTHPQYWFPSLSVRVYVLHRDWFQQQRADENLQVLLTPKTKPIQTTTNSVHISPLALVLIMRLTPGLMLEEEAAVTVTVYCAPGLTFTTSACKISKTQTPGHNIQTLQHQWRTVK